MGSQDLRSIRSLLQGDGHHPLSCTQNWKPGLSSTVALFALGWCLLTVQLGQIAAAEPATQENPQSTATTEPEPNKADDAGNVSRETFVIDGRVLDPDSQPFAGAKLYAIIKRAEEKPPQLKDPAQPPFEMTERPGQAPLLKMVHPKVVAIFKRLGRDTAIAADDPFMRSPELESEWLKIMPDLYTSHPATPPPVRATSGVDGSFRFELPQADIVGPLEQDVTVVAVAPPLGPAWSLSHEPGSLSGLELRLAEDLPVQGRIVDSQGKPVAGAVVRRGPLMASPEGNIEFWKDLVQAYMPDLDPRLTPRNFNSLQTRAFSYQFPGSRLNLFPREFVTDSDGRFSIRGVGANRVLYKLQVSALHEGNDTFSVATVQDPGLPALEATRWGQPRPEYRTYGATFEHRLPREQIIEGTIRDSATGKPVPNVQVAARSPNHSDTFTDADGKYRLRGLSQNDSYSITVWPWENRRSQQPYLNLTKWEDGTGADGPIIADFSLIRGVILRGKLTDLQGKAIADAQVHYGAYPEGGRLDATFYPHNPKFPAPKSGVIIAPFDVPMFQQAHTQTDHNGQYSLIVLPGKGVLGIFVGNQYAAAEQVQEDPELKQFSGTVPRLQGYSFNAIKPLEVPLDASEIEDVMAIDLKPAPKLPEFEELE